MDDNILKDLVLSTLSEIEEEESLDTPLPKPEPKRETRREIPNSDIYRNPEPPKKETYKKPEKPKKEEKQSAKITLEELSFDGEVDSEFDLEKQQATFYAGSSDEVEFLENILKKSATLVEGLKSSELKSREAKCDITLKYLQFLNVEILNRLERIN
jgi:outer membrane biosynthesis protein TonB